MIALAVVGCRDERRFDTICSSERYAVYVDSVEQGEFMAVATSPYDIVSTYKAPQAEPRSSKVSFRLAINGRDNELPATLSHTAIIGDTASRSKVYTFGQVRMEPDSAADAPVLGHGARWTVKVDMRPVLKAFERRGYYRTPTGEQIAEQDFKGVWIAGDVAPLSCDFESLSSRADLKLKDRGDSIYQITLVMNRKHPHRPDSARWHVDGANGLYPRLSADQRLVAAMYNMSVDDISKCKRPDGGYSAAADGTAASTSQLSYATYLTLALLDPDGAKRSLRSRVSGGSIMQDPGAGGSWPVVADRVVWGMAAWEVYMATGDSLWLREAYDVLAKTLRADRETCFDSRLGLMHGGSSFIAEIGQTYPRWMGPKDIYESMGLRANVIMAHACRLLGQMRQALGDVGENHEIDTIVGMAPGLRREINTRLWIPDKGYYSGYLYGGVFPLQSPATDNLGQALAIILGVAYDEMAQSIISRAPMMTYGVPAVYPQQAGVAPYINDAVWPMAQAMWCLAAARVGNLDALSAGIAAIYRGAALFGTNLDWWVASTGNPADSPDCRDGSLCSAAGNTAMVTRVYMGMQLTPDGVIFKPVVPDWLQGEKTLQGVRYREATLDVTVIGTGTIIRDFRVDGVAVKGNPIFPSTLSGRHSVEIVMADDVTVSDKYTTTSQVWMTPTPRLDWTSPTVARITNPRPGERYDVYLDGVLTQRVDTSGYTIDPATTATFVEIAGRDNRGVWGFAASPHLFIPDGALIEEQAEDFATPGSRYIVDKRHSEHFVELGASPLTLEVDALADGYYLVDVRYANGSSDPRGSVRTLTVDDEIVGTIVMPRRAPGEWLNLGYSNMVVVRLHKGVNRLSLRPLTYGPPSASALVDYIRLVRL